MTNGSCHSRCESNVQTWLNPWLSARRASSTVREAGGFVCSTTPKSMGRPFYRRYWDRPRGTYFPCPARPW